jgi:hypothetical protein
MSKETIQIVSAILCVVLVIALILRRKAKAKKPPSDGF